MFGREKLELLFREGNFFQRFKAAVYQICDGGVVRNFLPSKSTNFYQNHLNFGKQVIFEYSATVLILFFLRLLLKSRGRLFPIAKLFFFNFSSSASVVVFVENIYPTDLSDTDAVT